MKTKRYLVSIRRNLAEVKPEAEQVDGKVYSFREGWPIGDEETSIYQGEWAMIAWDKDYPDTAPTWIASGDLQEVESDAADRETATTTERGQTES